MGQVDVLTDLRRAVPGLETSEFRGQQRVAVPRKSIYEALKLLKQQLGFDLLVDLSCVDYLHYRSASPPSDNNPLPPSGAGQAVKAPKERFGLLYLLASTASGQRLTVRTFVNDPEPTVPSVVALWEGANWLEREVWDLFGIRFSGHPDLRRIVLPTEFTGHPLRKDYPLQGRGERHNLPIIRRGDN
jgi:NADH-quinone oxidoreductase subunit C